MSNHDIFTFLDSLKIDCIKFDKKFNCPSKLILIRNENEKFEATFEVGEDNEFREFFKLIHGDYSILIANNVEPKANDLNGRILEIKKLDSIIFSINQSDSKCSKYSNWLINEEEFFNKANIVKRELSQLYLTKKQKEIVEINTTNGLIVKGAAGSGKTTVAIWRAFNILRECLKEKKKVKLLFTSYSTELVGNLSNQRDALIDHFYKNNLLTKNESDFIKESWIVDNVDNLTRKIVNDSKSNIDTNSFSFKNHISYPIKYGMPIFLNFTENELNKYQYVLNKYIANGLIAVAVNGNLYIPKIKVEYFLKHHNINKTSGIVKVLSSDFIRKSNIVEKAINGAFEKINNLKNENDKKSQNNKLDFLSLLPERFFKNLFENILIQKEFDKEYFLNEFEFSNFHNVFTKTDREVIWLIFEEYLELEKKDSENYYSYERFALDAIPLIKVENQFDYVLVDEAQDLGAAKIEFLISLLKTRNSNFSGLSIFCDSTQTLFNQFFNPQMIMPLSYKKQLGENKRSVSRELETVFRNPIKISRAAEYIKSLVNRKNDGLEISKTNSPLVGLIDLIKNNSEIKDNFVILSMPGFESGNGHFTILKSKGCEYRNILIDNMTIPFYLEKEFNYMFQRFPFKNEQKNQICIKIIEKVLEVGTAKTSSELSVLLSEELNVIDTVNGQKFLRQIRYFLSSVDAFLCFVYVAVTRTQENLYIRTPSENNKDNYLQFLSTSTITNILKKAA